MFDNLRAFCWLMMTAGILIMPLDSGNATSPEPVALETTLVSLAVLGLWIIETANRMIGFVGFIRAAETTLERTLVFALVGMLIVLLFAADARGYGKNVIMLAFLSLVSATLIGVNVAFDRLVPKKS